MWWWSGVWRMVSGYGYLGLEFVGFFLMVGFKTFVKSLKPRDRANLPPSNFAACVKQTCDKPLSLPLCLFFVSFFTFQFFSSCLSSKTYHYLCSDHLFSSKSLIFLSDQLMKKRCISLYST